MLRRGGEGPWRSLPASAPTFPLQPPTQAHGVLQRASRSWLRLTLALSSSQPEGVFCEIQSKLGNNTKCLAKWNAFLPFLPFPQIVPYKTKWVRCSSPYMCWNMCLQEISEHYTSIFFSLEWAGAAIMYNFPFSCVALNFPTCFFCVCVCVHYLCTHSTNIYRVPALCQCWTRYRMWWWENRDPNLLTVLFWYKREATKRHGIIADINKCYGEK